MRLLEYVNNSHQHRVKYKIFSCNFLVRKCSVNGHLLQIFGRSTRKLGGEACFLRNATSTSLTTIVHYSPVDGDAQAEKRSK